MENKKIFIPENKSLGELFLFDGINSKKIKKFNIPDYQRQYSWVDKQLNELWDDFYEAFQYNVECYFLGSIVIVKKNENDEEYYDLIDGQQRITTLVIMMNVLIKDFKEKLRDDLYDDIKKYLYSKKEESILILQSHPNYDKDFRDKISKKISFNDSKVIPEEDLKRDEPKHKYLNAAYFFYKKFNTLDSNILNKFVKYIFENVNVIRTICEDENFAIKMFQSLNDRGLELNNSDIFKSWLYSKCPKNYRSTFNSNWKELICIANDYSIKMDDFIIYYEYYLLKSNPELSVTDELKKKLKDMKIEDIMSSIIDFMKSIIEIFDSKEFVVYSLRYIPWKNYVITALGALYNSEKYSIDEKNSIMDNLRRLYYISYIAGSNVNTIKQVSFDLIASIVNEEEVEEIRSIVDNFIHRRERIKKVYENINGPVYGERFLKPLMLSIDNEYRENGSINFVEIDDNLHLDHVIPKQFETNSDWNYIREKDKEKIYEEINSIGNMALLQGLKNEKALNCGLPRKLNFYKGLEADGVTPIKNKNGKGVTQFETTRKIIDEYKNKEWGYESIIERKKFFIEKIEKLLEISEEDIIINYDDLDEKSSKSKWEYKGRKFNNKDFIAELLKDYIESNNIKNIEDIPSEIINFKLYHGNFISKETEKNRYLFSYKDMKLYLRSVYYSEETKELASIFKEKMDNIDYEELKDEDVEFQNMIRNKVLENINKKNNNKYFSDSRNSNKLIHFIQFFKKDWEKDSMHFELLCDNKIKWKNKVLDMNIEFHLEKKKNEEYKKFLNKNLFTYGTERYSIGIYNNTLISKKITCDFTNDIKIEETINEISNILNEFIKLYENKIDNIITKQY